MSFIDLPISYSIFIQQKQTKNKRSCEKRHIHKHSAAWIRWVEFTLEINFDNKIAIHVSWFSVAYSLFSLACCTFYVRMNTYDNCWWVKSSTSPTHTTHSTHLRTRTLTHTRTRRKSLDSKIRNLMCFLFVYLYVSIYPLHMYILIIYTRNVSQAPKSVWLHIINI